MTSESTAYLRTFTRCDARRVTCPPAPVTQFQSTVGTCGDDRTPTFMWNAVTAEFNNRVPNRLEIAARRSPDYGWSVR